MRLVRMIAAAAAAAALAVGLLCPAAALADEPVLDIGTLSNRYQALEEEELQADETDNVVVATRVGVLTAANRALNEATVSFTGEVVGDIMSGGEGYIGGTVVGSILIATIGNVGTLLGLNSNYTDIIIGLLIVVSVLIDRFKRK